MCYFKQYFYIHMMGLFVRIDSGGGGGGGRGLNKVFCAFDY